MYDLALLSGSVLSAESLPFPPCLSWENLGSSGWQRQPASISCRQKGAEPQSFAAVTGFVVNKAKCHLSSLP